MAIPDFRISNARDRISPYPVAAAQTILKGQPVALDGAGRVILATAVVTSLVGIAAQDISAPAVDTIVYIHDDPKAQFECKASLVGDIAAAVRGSTYDLDVTAGVVTVDLGASAVDVVRLLEKNTGFDGLADGETYEGSTLAGNYTPGWRSANRIIVEIAAHQLDT